MERSEYLKRAQRCSVKFGSTSYIWDANNFDASELVRYGGIAYFPIEYLLAFEANGEPRHSVMLRDLHTSSYVQARLEDVTAADVPEAAENGAEPRDGTE